MLSREDNDLFTQVGPGTPCGETLRRYWQPVCPAAELTPEKPKKRVRLLGEDFVVCSATATGRLALPEHCPHRHASLYRLRRGGRHPLLPITAGSTTVAGKCVEQPFEPPRRRSRPRSAALLTRCSNWPACCSPIWGPIRRRPAAALGDVGARRRLAQHPGAAAAPLQLAAGAGEHRPTRCTPIISTATCSRCRARWAPTRLFLSPDREL